ncbi:NUDIX hydrolase [Haladaptatus sp. GCM10025707]|uniref:NUDIX hydrolase n=1 Tax=unclassified Haladaptatus TaxID=2622732 RepID=UPI0023E80079|nr:MULTISPECIES: NUDIX hydrolase [unclassified Haladaptatus]
MSITARMRRHVEETIRRFDAAYGTYEIVEKEATWSTERYDEAAAHFDETGDLGGAGVWLSNRDGEVLLIQRDGETTWTAPGGYINPDETYEQTARREVREETSVECLLTGLNQVHVTAVTDATDPTRPTLFNLSVVFDGQHLSGTPTPEPGEVAAVKWWDVLPTRLQHPELHQLPLPERTPSLADED